jgi:hypothetical protein
MIARVLQHTEHITGMEQAMAGRPYRMSLDPCQSGLYLSLQQATPSVTWLILLAAR